jgi:hypothetical protein
MKRESQKIKRLEDFPLNEGILSSIGSAVGQVLSGKKSKLNGILKKIRDARVDDINHVEKIEKEIYSLQSEDTPETRFTISNLNRQRRSYSSIKNQEIDSLMKSAEKTIKDNPKLSAFFHSELAEIQSETTDKMIKSLKPYKKSGDLDDLAKEFEDLIKDTEAKKTFYSEIESSEYVSPEFSEIPKNISKEILSFIDMPSKEASALLRNFNDDKLEYYKSELESWRFNLEIEYDKALTSLRKDIKKAKESGNTWAIPTLEKEEATLKYTLKKPIDKIRAKNSIIEREMKIRMN